MVLTVGHGTLDLDALTSLLADAGVAVVVDVRSYPGSRRFPWFAREALGRSIPAAGMAYQWQPALGGRRRPVPDSANVGLRNPAFRAYADHMATDDFRSGLARLAGDAGDTAQAIMCSESVWWRCHRRLIADALVLVEGVAVEHLFHDGRRQAHLPTPEARVDERGVVVYDLGRPPPLPLS